MKTQEKWEIIDKIFEKHTVALTKRGDKDFNPPEIIDFDTIVVNSYEIKKEILSLLSQSLKEERARLRKEVEGMNRRIVAPLEYKHALTDILHLLKEE